MEDHAIGYSFFFLAKINHAFVVFHVCYIKVSINYTVLFLVLLIPSVLWLFIVLYDRLTQGGDFKAILITEARV